VVIAIMKCTVSQFSSNEPSEDFYSIKEDQDISLFCVLDGHGGTFSCKIANSNILNMLFDQVSALSKPAQPGDVIQAISQSFENCDRLILEEAEKCRVKSRRNGIRLAFQDLFV
jgi:serine/threonine protein phosphatase PrpC